MACLDTNIIIDLLKNEKGTVKKIKELEERGVELSTTTINSFELFKGSLRSNQKEATKILLELLNNLKILSFNFKASEKAAEIFEELRIKGEAIDALDLMIASIAIVNNETLMTKNTKHFERMRELKIEA